MLNVIVLLLSLSLSNVSNVPYSHIVENDYLRDTSGENIDYVLASNDYFVNDKIVFSHDLYAQAYSFYDGLYIGSKNDIEYSLLYRISNIPLYSSNDSPSFDDDMIVYFNLVLGARSITNPNKKYYAIGLMGEPILISNDIYTNVIIGATQYVKLDYIDFNLDFDTYDQFFYFNGFMHNLTFYQDSKLTTIENNIINELVFDITDFRYIGASPTMSSWFYNFSGFNYFGYSPLPQNRITIVSHKEYLPNTDDFENYYTDIGFDLGYDTGYEDGLISKGLDNWLVSIFGGMGALLNIQILPNLTIGSIIMIFLAIPLTYAIIKLMKGGGD